MKKSILITLLLFIGVNVFGQKVAPYKYLKVDTVLNFNDATIIIYNDKKGNHKADTIWLKTQNKNIDIDEAEVVITDSRYLKPRFKIKK